MTAHETLKKYFGYEKFRPLQQDVVEALMQNKDVLLLMPTGGGKSICFQLPALMKEGTALVISPLIALMKDQVQSLKANGVNAAFLNSSLNREQENEIVDACLKNELKLLYLSPEKALALKDTLLSQLKISMIAIDEAHCISTWGHDFRPEYQQMKFLREKFLDAPVITLTATADKVTRKDIIAQMELREPKIFIASFDRPNLSLKVKSGIRAAQKLAEIIFLVKKYPNDSGIIYCLSRKSTEEVSEKLKAEGISVGHYHAGMSSDERSKIQEAFIKDEVNVICATIAFGMGIDKSNVRYVVHYNMPKNLESYYQEIGRSGRDGLPSETVLYYSLQDLIMLKKFADESAQRELNLEKLKQMQDFAEAKICRRKILLNYFSESMSVDCGNCDVCKNPPKFFDGTLAAQKVLSAMMRTDEKAGANMLINILRGSANGELLDKGFDKLKTYGAGKEFSFDLWKAYIMQMLQLGVIELAYDENYAFKITEFGKMILYNKAKVHFFQPELRAEITRTRKPKLKPSVTPATTSESTHGGADLFEELRQLRKLIAVKAGLPPYIIFNDATLKAMAQQLPATESELLNITGVGQHKMEKYGNDFIQVIKAFATK